MPTATPQGSRCGRPRGGLWAWGECDRVVGHCSPGRRRRARGLWGRNQRLVCRLWAEGLNDPIVWRRGRQSGLMGGDVRLTAPPPLPRSRAACPLPKTGKSQPSTRHRKWRELTAQS